jgi:energy-coupling factor transport system permease protein
VRLSSLGLGGNAFHYRDTRSPVHRLGAGWKLALATVAAAVAIAARSPAALAALLLAVVAGYRLARLSPSELWQDARWPLLQALVVTGLHALRDGAAGLGPGLRVGVQLALFFLPGALLLRTTPVEALGRDLERWLPRRLAFALSSSLRFLPYLTRELHEIVMAQRLRGARLDPRRLWHPGTWRDWVHCVGVPATVRALKTASDAALAARARGLDCDGLDREEEHAA